MVCNLNGIGVARRCGKEPLRSVAAKPEEEEIAESDEKINPVNARSETNSMNYVKLVKNYWNGEKLLLKASTYSITLKHHLLFTLTN